jgi:hypothetical protein
MYTRGCISSQSRSLAEKLSHPICRQAKMATHTTGTLCSLCKELMLEALGLDESLWSTESWTDAHRKWWYTLDDLRLRQAGLCSICDVVQKNHRVNASAPGRAYVTWARIMGRSPGFFRVSFHCLEVDCVWGLQQEPPQDWSPCVLVIHMRLCAGSFMSGVRYVLPNQS